MKIEKLDNKGRGITYYNDVIMFVNNALPGEEVEITNVVNNKKFYSADACNINNKNANRVIPKCPYYDVCGGCNLEHITIEHEDEYKKQKVAEILKKYADLEIPIKYYKNDLEMFYRNKVTLKVEDNKWGYFNESSHTHVEITKCLIAQKSINDFFKVKDFINLENGTITIRTNYLMELMLIISSEKIVKINKDKIPSNVAGIIVNNKCVYKNAYFFDKIGDLEFRLSYDSFFQVNNYMASMIFKILKNNLKGKNLLDLYCGVGTLGLSLKDNFKNIYGIEKTKNAVIDAKYNAKANKVSNAFYYAGDTAKILEKLDKTFDTIIIDPPRSGLNNETLEHIKKLKPKTICYVSCDIMTLARDIKLLSEMYKVLQINALNMFPRTYHVECVCVMGRR